MASALGGAIGIVGGYAKWREGQRMQRSAQRAIDNFQWQELTNPYKNLQVSTMGADLEREEGARASSTAVDTLRSGGSRALGVGIGRIMAADNIRNRQIGAGLDKQRKDIDFAAANDDVRIQSMIEKRQAEELAGYGQKLSVGMNMKYGGVSDLMNGAMFAGTGGMSGLMGTASQLLSPKNSGSTPTASVYGTGSASTGYYNDNAATYGQNYGTYA